MKYTQRQIDASVHSSRNTIREVLHLEDENGLHWPLDDSVTNDEIRALLYPVKLGVRNPRKEPDYNYVNANIYLSHTTGT